MKKLISLQLTRTHKNIRTRRSIRTNTLSGRALWPRLKETEQLRIEEQHLCTRMRRAGFRLRSYTPHG